MGLSTDGANVNELIHFGVGFVFPFFMGVCQQNKNSQPAAAQTGPDQRHHFAFLPFIFLVILFCSMKGR
jgi:hypothetical protein